MAEQLDLPRSSALNAVLVGSAFQLFLIPLLDTRKTFLIVVAAVGGLLGHAAMYGPQAAFISELFSTRVRYSGASSAPRSPGCSAAPGPDHLHRPAGPVRLPLPVSLYVLAGLVVTAVSVWVAPETARIDLHEERADERRIVQDFRWPAGHLSVASPRERHGPELRPR